MIKNYFKTAFRSFWRHKLFTFINVAGLSIGISASVVIYLMVHYELTFDKFHKDSDRMYRVVSNFTFSGQPVYNSGVSGPLVGAIKTQVTGLQQVAATYRLLLPTVIIPHGNQQTTKFKMQRGVVLADEGYFKMFGYKWLAGSSQTALDQPNQVVITSKQAALYYPAVRYNDLIGKAIVYDTIRTTISGVVENLKENSDLSSHDFISYNTYLTSNDLKRELRLNNWGGTSIREQLFVKLLPGTKPALVLQQLNTLLKKNSPDAPGPKVKTQHYALQPFSDIHFSKLYSLIDTGDHHASKATLYALLAIASFLLLLGCINFINLTTAQASQRAKEIGIRKTMGSSRKQIIVQFLSETFFITIIAVGISIAITPFILKLFAGFIPEAITAYALMQPAVILFLILLTVGVGLLSGFYPAIILSGYKPVSVLKNQAQSNSSKTRSGYLRRSLTVSQFAIAQFFIMATLLVSKQIYYATHKDIGFKKDAIITVTSPYLHTTANGNALFLNKLRTLPQVDMVSVGNDAPTSENTSSTQAIYRDGKKEMRMEVAEKFGDANYIKLYHIKLLAGRNLQPTDTNKNVLINENYAHLMGFTNLHDAVGRQINEFNGDRTIQVIGVVSDFQQQSMHVALMPMVLFTSSDMDYNRTFHIALKPKTAGGDEWQKAFAGIGTAWKSIYPADDFQYDFVDETIARLYESEQQTATLLNWATGLSIFISCLGLLGLALYTTNQRTKEIGVRKVLGASVTQIVGLLTRELIWLIAIAFVLVTPVAWYAMNKWMEDFADRTPISWWIFAGSGAGMLLTALITSSFQTVKAAITNPVNSLRSE